MLAKNIRIGKLMTGNISHLRMNSGVKIRDVGTLFLRWRGLSSTNTLEPTYKQRWCRVAGRSRGAESVSSELLVALSLHSEWAGSSRRRLRRQARPCVLWWLRVDWQKLYSSARCCQWSVVASARFVVYRRRDIHLVGVLGLRCVTGWVELACQLCQIV